MPVVAQEHKSHGVDRDVLVAQYAAPPLDALHRTSAVSERPIKLRAFLRQAAANTLQRAQLRVRLRPPIAIELPHFPHLANLIEIQHRRDQFIFVT